MRSKYLLKNSIAIVLSISSSILIVLSLGLGISHGVKDEDLRFEVGSSPYNVTYKEWAQRWWQWYVSVPLTHSPNTPNYPNHIANQTCSVFQNESSPVFFLFTPLVEEKIAERTCTVPKDKAILIPIVSGMMDTGDPELTEKSDRKLIEDATAGNNNAIIEVKLDGTTLAFNHDQKYRILTNFFNITLPEHHLWEDKGTAHKPYKPGTYKGVADGYYLFLKPLPRGEHLLYYEAGTYEPNPNQYVQEVTYHLVVE